MVSKPTGSRPPGQSRAKRRGDQRLDVVDRPTEAQPGTSRDHANPSGSRLEGERMLGATGGRHSHTMPLETSVPIGGQQVSNKADWVAKRGHPEAGKHSQTLLGHVSHRQGPRVRPAAPGDLPAGQPTPRGGTSGGPLAGPPPGAARPTTAASSHSLLRVDMLTSSGSRQQPTRDPKERQPCQGAPHTLPTIHHQAASRDLPPAPPPSYKHGKDTRERYLQLGHHRQQATTLPPGGASGNGGGRHHQGTPRQAPFAQPITTVTTSTVASGSMQSSNSIAQAQRTSSSRDNHSTTERRQLPLSISGGVAQGGGRERDIARITIDARTIVTRPQAGSNNVSRGVTPYSQGSQGASGGVPLQQSAPHPRQQYPTPAPRRNPAPMPPTGADGNQQPVSQRSPTHRTTSPGNLHLDIVDLDRSEHILTNNLSAGISYGRPERPETTEALPDILNSHILPPYTVRQNQHRASRTDQHRIPGCAGRSAGSGCRSQRRSRSRSAGMTQLDEEGKSCCSNEGCLRCITVVTTFRWVLVSLALLGVICVITGIVLGALHMTVGSSFLTLSLMFIGLGVMLVIVVGVGWKCTPQGHEPCHLLFNLGDHCTRDIRSSSSHRRHRDRNHWYGGVTYPEFRYRRPPPSYSASMQEFQQQLMLAQIQLNQDPTLPPGENGDNYSLPSSPPPSYKSRASTIRPGLHITFPPQGASYPSSQPPTYRSRDTSERPTLNMEQGGVDNLACSDVEAPLSMSSAASSATSPSSSSRTSPARSLPSSTSSTLHYAADRAVDYLDNVLQHHDHTLEHGFRERPARPVTGEPVVVIERPARPVTGGVVVVEERPARPVTGGSRLDAGGKTPIDTLESAPDTGLAPGAVSSAGIGGMASGTSLSSVHTTASLEETDRIQDTQL